MQHSSELGDFLGMESSNFHPTPDIDIRALQDDDNSSEMTITHKPQREPEVTREFPPPMRWLARTMNLKPRMPWVFKRIYTPDGRLIIREERVKRHEYFEARRSNGRLVLELIQLDDVVDEACRECHANAIAEEEEEEKEEEEKEEYDNKVEVEDKAEKEEINGEDEEEEANDPKVEDKLAECSIYNEVGANPCGDGGFGVAFQTLNPPVHI